MAVIRVWTAIQCGVHSKEFIFKALKDHRQGVETAHDVYCSECGTLTMARTINKAEGGEPNIYLAGVGQTVFGMLMGIDI